MVKLEGGDTCEVLQALTWMSCDDSDDSDFTEDDDFPSSILPQAVQHREPDSRVDSQPVKPLSSQSF